jgi:undecaprenyl phosphate N,N'-diacetylbacillosamine 1-phosphate transferase
MYNNFFKPLFDFTASLIALILLSPMLLLLIVVLAFVNKGQPFFFQQRPGKNGVVFKLIKFKTMRDAFDNKGVCLSDKKRITPFGGFVRKSSLDELPQLINVVKGDMSLIGPRPLLVKYVPLYSKTQIRRHEVKPGITGWAQVNGRNAIDWNRKFELDVWYVDDLSFALDMKILFLTVLKVFKREGINATQNNTMLPFEGNL